MRVNAFEYITQLSYNVIHMQTRNSFLVNNVNCNHDTNYSCQRSHSWSTNDEPIFTPTRPWILLCFTKENSR
ncbi:hypothetical protein ANTPLA_LOCUS6256 [Anthophora plagiata]